MISEEGLRKENNLYYFTDEFIGFSGELDQAEKVTQFTMTVYDKNQILIYGCDIQPENKWKIEDFALIYGINTIVFKAIIGDKFDEKKIVIYSESNINFNQLNLDLNDDDGDGLPNYLEMYFGTRIDEEDTDKDGLSDYMELYTLGYNPLEPDTDKDGIWDGEEDEDGDGISNYEECVMGSNPISKHSDNDRLSDDMELNFGTSPINEDSDGNGVDDYLEYCLSKMNATYDNSTNLYTVLFTPENMGVECDETVIPTVKLTADAEVINSFSIEKIESSYFLNPFMTGYIGAAYDFHVDGEIYGAELTFTYNESMIDQNMLNAEDFTPTIYYFDPDSKMISEVEGQNWNGNEVTVSLPHFSTYILLNKADLLRLWNETINLDETSKKIGNHVVFVIDKSGSMRTNDQNNIRAELIKDFCSRLGDNDKVGLVGFANDAKSYTNDMTNLRDILSDSIDIFKSEKDYGGTYMKKGVDLAIEMLQIIESENIQQTIFCLTDGVTNDYISKDYLEKIAEDGIKIYTIGLGQVSASYLQYIADTTGGQYYYAKTSQELKDVFTDFEEEVSNDRNKDGLDDEITKLICKGEITTLLGNRVFCSQKNELSWEAMYDKIMGNDDYDGDGLRNGDEIKIIFIDDKPYIDLICSPEYPDSDCDMISDSEELNIYLTNPLKSDYIVDSEDLMFINDCTNFEAGKAFDEYLNRPDYQIVAEYAFNVIICGGEINIIKMAKNEILDLFVSYADANVDSLELSSEINLVNSLLRGYIDLCVGLGLEFDRIKINSQISQIQKEIMSLRGVDFSKLTKKALKGKIKGLNNLFKQHAEKANAIGKKGGYLGLALTAITSGLQTYEECGEYAAALEVSREYYEILNELKQCGNKNIETAAEQICEDMSGVQEKFMPYGSDYIKNMTVALGTAYSSYLLATTVPGLIADIIWLGADITLGNSFDAQITNFISVDCANGVSSATYKNLSGALYKKDKLGRVKLVLMENYSALTVRRMYELDIYAREWAETKYLRYLSNSGGLFKQNMIIFKTENSERNAQNNISKLQKMYMDAVSRDIQ